MDPITSEPAAFVWLVAFAVCLGVFVIPLGAYCWLKLRKQRKQIGGPPRRF